MTEDFNNGRVLINALYSDRVNYTIVGLTGYSGTGCSRLAELMSKSFNRWEDLRIPKDLIIPRPLTLDNEELMYVGVSNHKSIGSTIFARKYTLCYNYANEHYSPFTVLKYSHALMFYTLRYLITTVLHEEGGKGDINKEIFLKDNLTKILKDKYRPSRRESDNDYREQRKTSSHNTTDYSFNSEQQGRYTWEEAHSLTNFDFNKWKQLIEEFENIIEKDKKENISETKQAHLFFDNGSIFKDFMSSFSSYLWHLDPYCTNFFYHRLGFTIRATGDPRDIAHAIIHGDGLYGKHLYCVAELINRLIKGYRRTLNKLQEQPGIEQSDGEKNKTYNPCRIVIDKIRNSIEAKYLKERYSAFYLIATHEERAVRNHLEERIHKIYESQEDINCNRGLTELQIKKIVSLDSIEREGRDFDSGKFFTQNLSQCVADAEIHISNEEGQGEDRPYFYSMSEQWMKYASLIQHPGLITPSSEERCMVVAYTAKFNSGCISRQVGAVITNKYHTIRTIGWNDVPYGQVPCSLRELQVMATGNGDVLNIRGYMYSDYETGKEKLFKDGLSFNDKVKIKYRNLHLGLPNNDADDGLMKGIPYPYCFKSLQNEFEREKNQVHIRSLHAEENAILQMAKYGGEALHQGVIYVTASPCELCCKKLYQIGVRKIVYIDEYPGISRQNIISSGYHRPRLKQFQGAYGATYFKLYQPVIAYKEELAIRLGNFPKLNATDANIKRIIAVLKKEGIDITTCDLTEDEIRKTFQQVAKKEHEHKDSENSSTQYNLAKLTR